MRLMTKRGSLTGLVAAAMALAVVFAPTAGAEAGTTTKKVGGGLWEYGVEAVVFSHYHHAKLYHSATACDGAILKTCKKKSAAPNAWAKTSTAKTFIGGNTAFWDTY
jgi:lactococcin 972 family bacteriocin